MDSIRKAEPKNINVVIVDMKMINASGEHDLG